MFLRDLLINHFFQIGTVTWHDAPKTIHTWVSKQPLCGYKCFDTIVCIFLFWLQKYLFVKWCWVKIPKNGLKISWIISFPSCKIADKAVLRKSYGVEKYTILWENYFQWHPSYSLCNFPEGNFPCYRHLCSHLVPCTDLFPLSLSWFDVNFTLYDL